MVRDSTERLARRGSTLMPIVGASLRGMPASYETIDVVRLPSKSNAFVLYRQCEDIRTFSSASENPRPALTRRLYLIEGHRTTGLSLSTGRGATAAAFVRRAFRRRDLRPGYGPALASCSERRSWMGRLEKRLRRAYLVEMGSDATLPVLTEICMPSVRQPGD